MGSCIALELAQRGAEVIFITGPTTNLPTIQNVKVVSVTSASQMYDHSVEVFPKCNAAILAAAVADYTPKKFSDHKIKRKDDSLTIELEATKDIAKELGKKKKKGQVLIGFALETQDEKSNALAKLQNKNLDFIVLNSANEKGAGFEVDTNRVTILKPDGSSIPYHLKPKSQVAIDIVNELEKML